MLLGLAGVSLPIIAHLLSRRRFDVVEWAAMQFLDPGKRTRRRLRLEELLLLLLRIGLILLLVVAAARPWIPTGFLSGFRSAGSRSVVIVIDGSNSMSRGDGLNTLHQNAIRRAQDLLSTLGPGDDVALVDCRDHPRVVIESPVHDHSVVSDALNALPPAGGFGNLRTSIERAVAMLGRSSAAAREVVVFSDRQRAGWQADDQPAWERVDEVLSFPAVRPRVWNVDVSQGLAPLSENVAVGKIELSREMTVPGFPIRLRVALRNSSPNAVRVPVTLKLDGQNLAEQQRDVEIPGSGETSIEFETQLRQTGTRLLSIAASPVSDALQVDNHSDAAIHVVEALPVLLVNGTRAASPPDRETFFASVALSAAGGDTPWVAATVVDADDVTAEAIQAAEVIVLANVESLPPAMIPHLLAHVSTGHGLVLFCGNQCGSEAWKTAFTASGLVPGIELLRIRNPVPGTDPVQVEPLSLVPGWLSRFRSDPERSLLKAGFQNWWMTRITSSVSGPESALNDGAEDGADALPPDSDEDVVTPAVLATLRTGDPLLIQTRAGTGTVLVCTSAVDRDWNDLPTRADFVPFLHEAIFAAVAGRNRRNVDAGQPLIADRASADADGDSVRGIRFRDPAGQAHDPLRTQSAASTQFAIVDTTLSGRYDLTQSANDAERVLDSFVVNYNHTEDEADELTDDDQALLATNDRVRFAASVDDLARRMYGDETRTELWAVLMFLFLVLLTGEVWMTRRIVKRGYGEPVATESSLMAG